MSDAAFQYSSNLNCYQKYHGIQDKTYIQLNCYIQQEEKIKSLYNEQSILKIQTLQ
ncbi:hypothetical protein pb186bvf_013932 [Paramecium bursaria]